MLICEDSDTMIQGYNAQGFVDVFALYNNI